MEITSIRNPAVRRARELQRQRKRRRAERAFFLEGQVFVSTAVEHGWSVDTLFVCDALCTDDLGRSVIAQQRAAGTPCVTVSREVFEALSQRNNPDGLAAILGTRWDDLAELEAGPSDVFVALVDVADPGNLGTVLRSLSATGGAGCILVGESTDPYHPRTIRATRGAVFTVPVARADHMDAVWAWARERHVHTLATSARGGDSYWHADLPLPCLLVMGSEHTGLDRATLAAADHLVTIPMHGPQSSLNLAAATTLLLFELRRRTEPGHPNTETRGAEEA